MFIIIHISIGLFLIYTNRKLPKMVTVFGTVFFVMSFLYWGIVMIDLSNRGALS